MGRKSLAEERTNQIIDAFETCIVQHGLAGATLQRTAERAEVNLGMIYHYIGRREALLKKMVTRLIDRQKAEISELVTFVPPSKRLPVLLSAFFEEEWDDASKIIEALMVESDRDPFVRELLGEINQLYIDLWAEEVRQTHPNYSTARRLEIATVIMGLVYGASLIDGLSPIENGTASSFKRRSRL